MNQNDFGTPATNDTKSTPKASYDTNPTPPVKYRSLEDMNEGSGGSGSGMGGMVSKYD